MRNRKILKISAVFFVVSIVLLLAFASSGEKSISITNPYLNFDTKFTTPSGSFSVNAYTDYRIPAYITGNVTIVTYVKLCRIEGNGTHGPVLFDHSSKKHNFGFNKLLNPGPGSYCLHVGVNVTGNKSDSNFIKSGICTGGHNFIDITSLVTRQNLSYFYMAAVSLISFAISILFYLLSGNRNKFL
jgi:hypothetical protein